METESHAMSGTPTFNMGKSVSSISLVLPAKDEQECIKQAICEASDALTLVSRDHEIIVVDDGSVDDTFAVASQAARVYPNVRVLRHERNRGYGAAIRTGFEAASKECVAFTDSDSQFELGELDRFLLLARDYDVVCGYRIERQDTWLRRLYSRGYNVLVRTLLGTGVRDIDCAMKLFRRSALDKVAITTDGFLVNSELITSARKNHLSIVEVGVTHRPRTQGTSTVSAAHIPKVFATLLRFWWNRVMFIPDHKPATKSDSRLLRGIPMATRLLLLVAAMLMLFGNLGSPLIDRDETRYAEIPREMVASGDWVVPQLNFKPYYDKPPLFYWLCAGSYKLFGVTESSARLVPASAAFLLLITTYLFGRRIVGDPAALLGAFILLLSIGFVFCGRFLIIDMVLSLFVVLSLFMAYEAIRAEQLRWPWWIAASITCGLGVLTKGPVAGVLLVPPLIAYVWLTDGVARPQFRHWFVMIVVSSCIVAPWAIRIVSQEPTFAYEFLVRHNLNRFAGAYHQEPFWFFAPVLLAGGHPWSFLAVPCLSFFFSRAEAMRCRRPVGLGFLALSAGWCVLFFSLSKCKLPAYILPAAPPLALLVGHYLDHALFRESHDGSFRMARKLAPWLASATTCVALIVLSFIAWNLHLSSLAESMGLAVAFCAALVTVIVVWQRNATSHVAWSLCAATALLLVVQVTQVWVPSLGKQQSLLLPGSEVTRRLKATHPPMVTFANEWSGVPFYLARNDVRNFRRDQIKDFARFVANNPSAIVVFDPACDLNRVANAMTKDTVLTRIADRGEATIATARKIPVVGRTASRPAR